MEYIFPSLRISAAMGMDGEVVLDEHMEKLMQLKEDCVIARFHQRIEKDRQKAWHDLHIKNKQFQQGDLVLLYDNKFMKHLGKLQMHWLGPYIVHSITSGGAVQLQQLDGAVLPTFINGSRLKPYRMGSELLIA